MKLLRFFNRHCPAAGVCVPTDSGRVSFGATPELLITSFRVLPPLQACCPSPVCASFMVSKGSPNGLSGTGSVIRLRYFPL